MAILDILVYPDSRLAQISSPVEKFDEVDPDSLKAPMWRFGDDWKDLDT